MFTDRQMNLCWTIPYSKIKGIRNTELTLPDLPVNQKVVR